MNSSISKTRAAPVPPPSGPAGGKGAKEKRPWWKQPLPVFCVALPLLIALGLVARLGYRSVRERMQVRAAKKLQEELFSEAGRQLPEEERREKLQKLRETQEGLSAKQQSELWKPRQQAMREEIKRFFEMSPQDQVAFLDKRINDMEEGRKRWEERRRQWQAGGGDGGGGGNGGAGGGGGATGGGGGAAGGGAGGGGAGGGAGGRAGGGGFGGGGFGGGGWGRGGGAGGGGGGPGGGGGGGGGAAGGGPPGGAGGRGAWNDPSQRQTMIKNMLDSSTPEDRVQMSLFFQMMQQRRTQRNLGPSPWGPR